MKRTRAVFLVLLIAAAFALPLHADPAPTPSELLSAGRADDAIDLLRARTQANHTDVEAWHLLTRTYFYMEHWDDAIAAARNAVSLKSDSSDYHLWLARAYGEKAAHSPFYTAVRMVPRIRGEFERAVQLDGNNTEARADLAQFYMEAPPFLGGSKDKALAQAAQLLAQDPADSHWINAQLAEKAKRYDDAERELLIAVKVSKSPAARLLDLAAFYHRTNRLDMMEKAIEQAVSEEAGRSGSVSFQAANLLFNSGRNFPEAMQLIRNYLRSNAQVEQAPAYRAHYLLGSILEKQGDRPAAASEYRAALSLARDFEQAQLALQRVQ